MAVPCPLFAWQLETISSCLWAWWGCAPDVLSPAMAALWLRLKKLPHKNNFFFQVGALLSQRFCVCTSLNCYRNILLSLIISLQFDLNFLLVLSRAVSFSNSSSLVFQMFLLHAKLTSAVLPLFPPSPSVFRASETACNIFMYSASFCSYTALFTSDPSIVVLNSDLLFYKEKLGWNWLFLAVGHRFRTSKMSLGLSSSELCNLFCLFVFYIVN